MTDQEKQEKVAEAITKIIVKNNGSGVGKLNGADVWKNIKGILIGLSGQLFSLLLVWINTLHFGIYTPFIGIAISAVIHAVIKTLQDNKIMTDEELQMLEKTLETIKKNQ